MTDGSGAYRRSNAYDRDNRSALLPQVAFGGVALASVVAACAWFLCASPYDTGAEPVVARYVAPVTERPAPVAARSAPIAEQRTHVAERPAAAAEKPAPVAEQAPQLTVPGVDVALLDAGYSLGLPAGTFSANAPGKLDYQFTTEAPKAAVTIAQDMRAVPAGARRPVQTASLQADPMPTGSVPPPRAAEARVPQGPNPPLSEKPSKSKVFANTAPERPTIFDKLFGKPQEPETTTLAYATPDGGVLSDGRSATPSDGPPYDKQTAVYDISAHTVYMPDGTKLEAHSGLGPMFDNPHTTNVRMRGATPPHIYELRPREGLFHGVRALRLIPIGGEGAIFGRTGILAHTYMLGPRGESNGCVSFRDYNAFLRAFQNQQVKRLAVVARLDG